MSTSSEDRGRILVVDDDQVVLDLLVELLGQEGYGVCVGKLSCEGIIVHREGKFTYLNPAAQKLWAASCAEDLIGTSVLDLVHPDYHNIVKKRLAQLQEFGQPAPLIEEKSIRLDGQVIDVEVAGIPITYQGKPAVQAVIRDVTEQSRARAALREADARLQTVVGRASLILFAIDNEGVFTLSEREGLKRIGLRPSQVVGQSVFELLHDVPSAN